MRMIIPACCVLALLLLPALAGAVSDAYRLGPDDAVTLTVLRHPEFSGDFLIPPDGLIDLPAIGSTRVSEKTVGELTRYVTEKLRARLRSPEVTITVRATRAQRVYVLGAVGQPGIYDVKPDWRVTEALTAAGGLAQAEDAVQGLLMREGRDTITLDLRAALRGDERANLPLQSGDTIKIEPLRIMTVMVSGQVRHPGSYQIKPGDGVVEAITLAGGALDTAALSRVTIARQAGVSETVNLLPAMQGNKPEYNAPLQADDLIIVPEATLRIAVLGFVNQPGYYPLPDGRKLSLSDAVGLAGGADKKRAGIGAVAVLHADAAGKTTRGVYDLRKFLKKGDLKHNPQIHAGDIIFVPETNRLDSDFIFQAMSAIGTLLGPVK